jgi:hypothetical protein
MPLLVKAGSFDSPIGMKENVEKLKRSSSLARQASIQYFSVYMIEA